MADTDEFYMAQAIREAEKGIYTCHPNPRVGCVLVKDGEVLSRGFHAKTGGAHAEADAISKLEDPGHAAGATAYVTLEPCSFEGRTPSCADALAEHRVARVVYAMEDPHHRNRGLGLKKLQAAGIEVHGPVMESEARQLNPGHLRKYVDTATRRPWARLKLAMSLDGKTALANGKSQWITSPEARRDVQKLRAQSAAIITGVQTVIDDNPSLTVREADFEHPTARLAASVPRKVVVLDSHGRIPRHASLMSNPNLVVATTFEAPSLQASQWKFDATPGGRVDVTALMTRLIEADCNEVLVECGQTLAGSFLAAGLIDELIIYTAPKMLGSKGRSLVRLPQLNNLQDAQDWVFKDTRRVGPDLRMTLVPAQ